MGEIMAYLYVNLRIVEEKFDDTERHAEAVIFELFREGDVGHRERG